MSGASSNTSEASSGGNASRRRGGRVMGIPKICWCGDETPPLMSRAENNPHQRYYCCATAARLKLENDNHVFKWIDDALINEVEILKFKTAIFEQEMREMKREEILLAERVEMKMEKELCDKMEEVVAEAKSNMKKVVIVGIVGCICVLGIIELFIKKW